MIFGNLEEIYELINSDMVPEIINIYKNIYTNFLGSGPIRNRIEFLPQTQLFL